MDNTNVRFEMKKMSKLLSKYIQRTVVENEKRRYQENLYRHVIVLKTKSVQIYNVYTSIYRAYILDWVYYISHIIIHSWPMKRLVLSGSKYNDGDVYGAAVTRYVIFIYYYYFFLDRRETRGGHRAIRVLGGPCQTDNNSLKLN